MEKEREKPKEISVVQEYPEIPEHIEKAGVVSSAPTSVTVTDDSGNKLISSVGDDNTQIVLPGDEDTLKTWSKGSVKSSLTWLGLFWIRMIKKALFLGKKIIVKKVPNS